MKKNELINISKKIMEMDYDESQKYANSEDFVKWVDSLEDKPVEFKNALNHLMKVKQDKEGFFLDAFGNRISYNGVKTLKSEGTKTEWNLLQKQEYAKCAKDFNYFFYNYCKIMTKKGYTYPEIRPYQKDMLNAIYNYDRVILSVARQLGKCVDKDTYIDIKNNETGQKERITIKEFNERIKNEEIY